MDYFGSVITNKAKQSLDCRASRAMTEELLATTLLQQTKKILPIPILSQWLSQLLHG
jgi:hypothetical protein